VALTDPVAVAAARVAAVRDDPEGRYALAEELYRDRSAAGDRAFGRGELAFLRWEVDRGVLDAEGGSPWWRAVNEGLLLDAAEAAALADAGAGGGGGARSGVGAWLAFFAEPSPSSWYQAHNTSVTAGYLSHARLAAAEAPAELALVNLVLSRVLFAHLLAAEPARALGRLRRVARFLGDPRSDAVGVVVHVDDMYPRHYPLSAHDRRRATDGARTPLGFLTALIDDAVVTRQLGWLHAWAARQLGEPALVELVRDGVPDYPWPLVLTGDELRRADPALPRPSHMVRLLRHVAGDCLGCGP
jgi:hypothetical protein